MSKVLFTNEHVNHLKTVAWNVLSDWAYDCCQMSSSDSGMSKSFLDNFLGMNDLILAIESECNQTTKGEETNVDE